MKVACLGLTERNLGIQTQFLPVDATVTLPDVSDELGDEWEPVLGCNAPVCTAQVIYHSNQTGDWYVPDQR